MNADAWQAEHRRRAWGQWPSESVVRYVMTKFGSRTDREAIHFLDIGCGGGAVSWFLRREGFRVTAVDFAAEAVVKTDKLVHGDALDLPGTFEILHLDISKGLCLPTGYFDCALDVACLQCLDDVQFEAALSGIARCLKPTGQMFSKHIAPDIGRHGGAPQWGPLPDHHRGVEQLRKAFDPWFSVDMFHESYWRRDPQDLEHGMVVVQHWLTEAVKR